MGKRMQPTKLVDVAVIVLVLADEQAGRVAIVIGLVWLGMRAVEWAWNRDLPPTEPL